MNKQVSDFLNSVCTQIKNKNLSLKVRSELSGHINDKILDLTKNGMSEDEAAKSAVSQMGNPVELGIRIRKINKPNPLFILLSAICFAGVIIITEACGIMATLDILSVAYVVVLTAAFSCLSCFKNFSIQNLCKHAQKSSIYAGIIGTILGIVNTLNNFSDPHTLGNSFAVSFVVLYYGIILSGIFYAINQWQPSEKVAIPLLD